MKDSELNTFIDEMKSSPLKFTMDGSKFRYELLKMAFAAIKSPSSINRLIIDAETLKDWVNNEQKQPTP